MAYATSNPPRLISQGVGASTGSLWHYTDGDTIATVAGSGYFTNGDDLGMEVNDTIVITDETNADVAIGIVTAVTAGGAATVSDKSVQELTATGAVTAGIMSVELNHASTIIAATIADAINHQGLFVVKDTSASGTAAHTLTLTAGTFNGTNNVVTMNAPDEALVVFFDSTGNGVIVENVGTVVLS